MEEHEATTRERLAALPLEFDDVRVAIRALIIKRNELLKEESDLIGSLTNTILANNGLDETGKSLIIPDAT